MCQKTKRAGESATRVWHRQQQIGQNFKILRRHRDSIESGGQSIPHPIGAGQVVAQKGIHLLHTGTFGYDQGTGKSSCVHHRQKFHGAPSLVSGRTPARRQSVAQNRPARPRGNDFNKSTARGECRHRPWPTPESRQRRSGNLGGKGVNGLRRGGGLTVDRRRGRQPFREMQLSLGKTVLRTLVIEKSPSWLPARRRQRGIALGREEKRGQIAELGFFREQRVGPSRSGDLHGYRSLGRRWANMIPGNTEKQHHTGHHHCGQCRGEHPPPLFPPVELIHAHGPLGCTVASPSLAAHSTS